MTFGLKKTFYATALMLSLAACKSSEERAEERYQSGLALLNEGDLDRAIVEFKNVFQLNGAHRDARITLANIHIDRDEIRQGYGQYLRLAEQYPDDLEVRLELAKLAFQIQAWDEFQRHGQAAIDLDAGNPEVGIIQMGLDYQAAVLDSDEPTREAVAARAEDLLSQFPNSRIVRNILIDHYSRSSQIDLALEQIDALAVQYPDDLPLQQQKLALIAKKEDPQLIEAQLMEMIERFPENDDLKSVLLRLYLSLGEPDKAEDFLRSISSPSDEDPTTFLELVRFITETKGQEAAMVEIERGIAESPNKMPFLALRAGFAFSQGRVDEAIKEMEEIIAANEPSEERRGIQIGLAHMFLAQGNPVASRRLVEEVLVEDARNVNALKMQATWQIDSDNTDGAILSLRTAIDSDPDDTEAVELLSQAYTRAGNHDLAREYLALAVETSGNAPEQSIRYAQALIERNQFLPAENVLIPALRLTPGDPELLAVLGRLYLAMDDQPRATQVIETLRRVGTDQTNQIANSLRADQLNAQNGIDDAVAFLQSLAQGSEADLNAQLMLLRGRLAAGDTSAAAKLVEQMVAENPDNERLPFAVAAVKSASGDFAGAAEDYRTLLADNPDLPRVWLELSRVLTKQGDNAAAEVAISTGLDINNDDPNLLWARASILEQENRIEEAIEIYEDLYEKASNSIIVANNLASLLSSYRTDQESLDRAYTVARRFNDTDIPALQDTYGWILHRRGESNEALPYLESAAAELDRDALTQYHLAMVYVTLGQTDLAKTQLQKTLDVAGPGDTRPQIEDARAKLAELNSAPATE